MPHNPTQNPLRSHYPTGVGESGIFRDVDALAGTETFNIYGVDGRRLGTWTAGEDVTDEALLAAFGDLLERKRLHLMPPSNRAPV